MAERLIGMLIFPRLTQLDMTRPYEVLGAAGLLKGKRATCHWAAIEHLRLLGATPVSQRVVMDGNIITGAGVASGIDFALAVAAILEGEEVAKQIQLQIEYDPSPPFDSGSIETASAETVALLRSLGAALSEQRRVVAERVGKTLEANETLGVHKALGA